MKQTFDPPRKQFSVALTMTGLKINTRLLFARSSNNVWIDNGNGQVIKRSRTAMRVHHSQEWFDTRTAALDSVADQFRLTFRDKPDVLALRLSQVDALRRLEIDGDWIKEQGSEWYEFWNANGPPVSLTGNMTISRNLSASRPLINHCPFCFGRGEIASMEDAGNGLIEPVYFVQCRSCGARGPHRETIELAISWWDRMHLIQAQSTWFDKHRSRNFSLEGSQHTFNCNWSPVTGLLALTVSLWEMVEEEGDESTFYATPDQVRELWAYLNQEIHNPGMDDLWLQFQQEATDRGVDPSKVPS